jgi:hypothetical protein
MSLRCRDCRREETIGAHLEEIDEQTWQRIESRRCDRT